MKKALLREERAIEQQITQLEQGEFGIKELITGLALGIVIGFSLAYFLFR